MTIKYILRDLCDSCVTRQKIGCRAIESCPTDVLKADCEGKPYIGYPEDCDSCFLCADDCPLGAIKVTGDIPIPVF